MTPEEVTALKATPFWTYLASFAPTMPIEGRALINSDFEPSRFSVLAMPVLFLVGSRTNDILGDVMRQLEPHMPDTRWHIFEGQGHGANLLAAEEFTRVVLEFLAR